MFALGEDFRWNDAALVNSRQIHQRGFSRRLLIENGLKRGLGNDLEVEGVFRPVEFGLNVTKIGFDLGCRERGERLKGPDADFGNAIIVTPLASSVPLPSPASGFTYKFDSSAGVYTRSSQSFGPILAERAETIGRNKLALGFAFQRFVFSQIDGLDIHNLQATGEGSNFLVDNTYNLNLQLNQFTSFATYGVTDRLDLSIAVPFSTVHFGLAYHGVVYLVDPSSAGIRNQPGIIQSAEGSHTASGLGDLNLQAKTTIRRWERGALAVGASIRVPTGDQYEALGAGAIGIRPFIAASSTYKRVSPHLNLGYQWNGKSVLAGNTLTSEKRHIPSQIQYAAGVDAGITRRLTVGFDVIGFEAIHADRFRFVANSFQRSSFNVTNGAVGFKFNPVGKLLLVFDLLFKMNDGGLRSKVAPLIGLTYGF